MGEENEEEEREGEEEEEELDGHLPQIPNFSSWVCIILGFENSISLSLCECLCFFLLSLLLGV